MREKDFRKLRLGKPRRLTAGLTGHEHPAISPDGRLLAYYAGTYGSIGVYVCDRRGRLARAVSPAGGNSTQPFWHPGGLKLAYRHQHSSESKWELWECDLAGGDSEPRALLRDERWHYKHPAYSPDGASMAYFTDEDSPGVYHIWVMELASGQRRQVSFGSTHMHCHPVFSPDGARIAYHAYEGTDENSVPAVTNLFELTLADGSVRELTQGTDQFKHPFYLDGDVIVYHHERNSDGRRRLEAMYLPTGRRIALTSGKANDKHPFPHTGGSGRLRLAWACKKLGADPVGTVHHYDIFIARLKGAKGKPRKKA